MNKLLLFLLTGFFILTSQAKASDLDETLACDEKDVSEVYDFVCSFEVWFKICAGNGINKYVSPRNKYGRLKKPFLDGLRDCINTSKKEIKEKYPNVKSKLSKENLKELNNLYSYWLSIMDVNYIDKSTLVLTKYLEIESNLENKINNFYFSQQ